MGNVLVDGGRTDAYRFCRLRVGHFLIVVESKDAFVLLREVLVDDTCQFVQQFVPFLCLVDRVRRVLRQWFPTAAIR